MIPNNDIVVEDYGINRCLLPVLHRKSFIIQAEVPYLFANIEKHFCTMFIRTEPLPFESKLQKDNFRGRLLRSLVFSVVSMDSKYLSLRAQSSIND